MREKKSFQFILKGQSFFRTLAVAIYQSSRLRKKESKGESTLAKSIADKFEKDYSTAIQPVLDRVRALLDGTIHLSVIEQIARCVSDSIRTQAHHFIATLKTRVIAHAPEWANTVGKRMLDAISTTGESKRDDMFSINWFLNAASQKRAASHCSQSLDGVTHFSALRNRVSSPATARMVPLYFDLFGKGVEYASHRGQLTYDLLFSGIKTNYDRYHSSGQPVGRKSHSSCP
ncbi:hypothetical protein BGZ94_006386 [Podila epigama]|nr:hypothetical protein BGZ94_006386 [Podila epigama]